MALLDPGTGALLGGAVFLVVLGALVVFVEALRTTVALAVPIMAAAVAVVLVAVGELGLALVAVGLGAAVLADHGFDWLTTR